MKRVIWILSFIFFVLWALPEPGFSLYRWRDEEGVIHITDVPPPTGPYEAVGEKKGNEEERSTPEKSVPQPGGEETAPSETPKKFSDAVYIPLRQAGNHYLVQMGINGQAQGYFLLDTGASMTVIGPQIAEKAGIVLDESLPILPLKTASGLIFPSVAHVEKFTLGNLILSGGDVVVHDIHFGKGVSGLLGMDLLSDYLVTLDTQKATLVLKPVKKTGPIYGGHSKKWWRSRFGFYRHILRSLENVRKVPERALKPYHITKERVEKSIEIYQERLDELSSLAEDELVPLDWRK